MEKGSSSSSSESLNGLSFGKKIYFEGAGSGYGARSPAKRGRNGVVHGGQPPRCQVEGCKVDLSDAKAYYCRHKVCGMHSKFPKVIVAGIEQRFCQQCSRFHQLGEFDQGKRSCRRRLAGHNERRRKPPPGPISLSSSRTGALVMDFTTYPNNAPQYWHNPQPHLLPPYNGAGVPSSSALSLLSNQLWGTNHFHQNNIQSTNPDASQFSWGFKGDKIGNDLREMHSDAQISVSGNEDLGLGQPSSTDYHELVEHPSDYDSSVHWSL